MQESTAGDSRSGDRHSRARQSGRSPTRCPTGTRRATLDDALPPGSAGIIAIYDHDAADAVAGALANAIRTSIAQIDKASADELKAGLKQASAGLTG